MLNIGLGCGSWYQRATSRVRVMRGDETVRVSPVESTHVALSEKLEPGTPETASDVKVTMPLTGTSRDVSPKAVTPADRPVSSISVTHTAPGASGRKAMTY